MKISARNACHCTGMSDGGGQDDAHLSGCRSRKALGAGLTAQCLSLAPAVSGEETKTECVTKLLL